MADISGTWLGTYWQRGKPTRFEATLIQSGGKLSGNILDNSYMGEATLNGEAIGLSVSFVKSYIAIGRKAAPVNYKGTISEDGNYMQGKWDFFGMLGFEAWEAHRSGDNLVADFKNRQTKRVPVSLGVTS